MNSLINCNGRPNRLGSFFKNSFFACFFLNKFVAKGADKVEVSNTSAAIPMNKITTKEINDYIHSHSIELFPTQKSLCIPIINRLYQKMVNGLSFDDIKVCEDLIIDGHHRYFSSLLANKTVGRIETHRTSATMKFYWHKVNFTDAEWDTEAKIQKMNEDDAGFNNIPIDRILAMTK